MSREDAACYRLYAANCVEIAESAAEPARRVFLLRMAQAWGKLAQHVEQADRAEDGAEDGSEAGSSRDLQAKHGPHETS